MQERRVLVRDSGYNLYRKRVDGDGYTGGNPMDFVLQG